LVETSVNVTETRDKKRFWGKEKLGDLY
jgi:hypothetical protein